MRKEDWEDPVGPDYDRDGGLTKVFGSLFAAVLFGGLMMIVIALAPQSARPWLSILGGLLFIVLGGLLILREVARRRQRG